MLCLHVENEEMRVELKAWTVWGPEVQDWAS